MPCCGKEWKDNKYIDGIIPENFYDTKASGSRAFLPNRFLDSTRARASDPPSPAAPRTSLDRAPVLALV